MKKRMLLTALAVSMFIACKKSSTDNPGPVTPTPVNPSPNPPAVSCSPVADTAIRNGFLSYSFTYLPNTSKIAKFQDHDGRGEKNGYTQYTYEAGKIFERDYYDNAEPSGMLKEYRLDEKGRIIMASYWEVFTSSQDTILFQYDENGNNTYRIHRSVGASTTIDTIAYSYVNNVRVKSEKIKNGKATERHEYEYTSNPDLVGYNELFHVDIGQARIPGKGLFGNMGPNLMAKLTYTNYLSGSNYVGTIVYEFDSNGYPVKVSYKLAAGSGGISFTDVTSYKYTCR